MSNAQSDQLGRDVFDLLQGSMASVGEVTLTANVATTTVTHRGVSTNSVIHLMALTANAAAEGVGKLITPSKGQFVITHTNNAQTDRTFRYHFHTPRAQL